MNTHKELKFIPITKAWLPFVLEVRNHEDTRKHLIDSRKFSLKEAKKFLKEVAPDWYILAIESESVSDEPVGVFKFEYDGRTPYVGCDIHPNYRRMGYASAAYYQVFSDIIINGNRGDVLLEVLKKNKIAIEFYKRLGFEIIAKEKRDGKKIYIMDKLL